MSTPPLTTHNYCKESDVEFLVKTAETTGGYCMQCAKRDVPGFEEKLQKLKSTSTPTTLEWVKTYLLMVIALPGFSHVSP
ncbi:MAG: hypothetical protein KDN22_31820, partial [Verrucomicrobiae bacterium]|nr:hypothetical protein [Verrucomicrobiae bacterium]